LLITDVVLNRGNKIINTLSVTLAKVVIATLYLLQEHLLNTIEKVSNNKLFSVSCCSA
jgi:hypothetical protein